MKDIPIDHLNVDNALRDARSGMASMAWQPSRISLGAALEIAFWSKRATVMDGIARWRDKSAYLAKCLDFLNGANTEPPQDIYAARAHEFFLVRAESDVVGLNWSQFLERFSASLRKAGFGSLSHGIAGALEEIAGNITQHSAFGKPQAAFNGIVAYSVEDGLMEFAVGDDGIGALESLRSNPVWASITNSRAALHAIARQHASRRTGQGEGQGYRELFGALASFDGSVRLRSGNGSFQMSGALDRCTPTGANCPPIPGFQLSARCRVRK